MTYIEKIHAMNALKLNPALFNALLVELKKAELQALRTAQAVALALQTNLNSSLAAPSIGMSGNSPSSFADNLGNAVAKFTGGTQVSKTASMELQNAQRKAQQMEMSIKNTIADIEKSMKSTPSV